MAQPEGNRSNRSQQQFVAPHVADRVAGLGHDLHEEGYGCKAARSLPEVALVPVFAVL